MEILLFGQLADIAGGIKVEVDDVPDTDTLKTLLEQRFPGLQQVRYMLAVNKMMVQHNKPLNGGDTVALMPPFSGG